MALTLKLISEGAPFDTNEAIRLIAGHLDQTMGGEQLTPRAGSVTPVTTELTAEQDFERRFERVAQVLIDGGFDTLDKVRSASDAELLALPGLGTTSLRSVRRGAGESF